MRPDNKYDPEEELHRGLLWAAAAVLLGALLALLAVWVAPAQAQEEDPVRNCWRLTESWEATTPGGDPQKVTWLLCPERSVRGATRSPLVGVLDGLHQEGPAESRWWAGQLRSLSAWSLEQGLCRAVAYVRSVSPPDPEDERDRSPEEIKGWVLSTLTGPDRPPEARVLRVLAEQWSPETLKVWHDELKAAWPGVAGLACPGMEAGHE